jgi:heme ABC exporter ATP-binding subunit CcmA
MIQTLKLEKAFGYRQALRGITLSIDAGQVVALVGPNGSGKTTLLRILATLMRPTRGRAAINGVELPDGAMEARASIGYVAHQTLLYDDLTVRENLRFYARLYALEHTETRIGEVAARLGIVKQLDDVTRALSRGYQQRAALARALLHRPTVYLYDEPYTGLDQASASLLDTLFAEAQEKGATVLFSTHDFSHGLDNANRVIIVRNGKIVYDGQREEWHDAVGFGEIYASHVQS